MIDIKVKKTQFHKTFKERIYGEDMAIVIPAIRHLTADEKDSLEEKSNQWNYPQLNNSNKERTKTGKLMEIKLL